ncbi:MAG: hypothetical protein A4E65_01331 [Syntrophorhabdus sp. PtaU1.Bin153]|nr:MAG: hypothetical protein A4E65_01331 [Syntrophorhabdus sp. PtaU1.Bin153]
MTESSGDNDQLNVIEGEADLVEEYPASGIHGSLRPDQVIEVNLGDHNVPLRLCLCAVAYDVLVPAVAFSYPFCRRIPP